MTTVGGASRRLSHLWQVPLLLVSTVVSASAAYLFLEAKPAITLNQKLAPAREMIRSERPDAAVESLSRLMLSEQLPREGQAQVHLLLAEALSAQQAQHRDRAPAAGHTRIIEETQIALAQGVKPTGEIHRRMGESYEALDKPVEAVSQYRQAIAMDPPRALRLQRKVIDLQLAQSDWAPADASLDAYLRSDGLTDAERAWAMREKAQLLIDRDECVDAKALLESALRLDADPIARAETRFRLGLCAWKLGKGEEAERSLTAARAEFNGQHPLDAQAAYVLGTIRQEKNEPAKAIELFDAALAAKPDASTAALAQLSRASSRIAADQVEPAMADLRAVVNRAAASDDKGLKEPALAALRKASAALAAKGELAAAIELLEAERKLEPEPSAGYFARLAAACERRAEQVERSVADGAGAEQARRSQLAREFLARAADAHLAHGRALAAAGDAHHAEPFWKAVEQYERVGNRASLAAALEVFAAERANDPTAPRALLRLGQTYEAMQQPDKAIGAYERLRAAHAKSSAAVESAVALAALYEAKGPDYRATAEKVLAGAVQHLKDSADPAVYRSVALELARLHYDAKDYRAALPVLELFEQKFPKDERLAEALFLAGECNARLAGEINVQVASATASAEPHDGAAELAAAAAMKKQHLTRAARQFERVRELLGGGTAAPTRDADRRYLKLSLLRRADCAFELGAYAEAVALYESAAKELDESHALAAQVQVANAYQAMGKPAEARAANERAKLMLRRMPREAGEDGSIPLPKGYWEQWLKWSGTGGTW